MTQYYQNSSCPHGIQNIWMTHFSPGNFLLHAACLQQHILTWTGLHTHHCSESSGLMDGEILHEHPVFKLLNLLMGMFLSSDRNFMAPLVIVPSAALNSIQIGYIATVSLFAEYANEVGFSLYITSIFIWYSSIEMKVSSKDSLLLERGHSIACVLYKFASLVACTCSLTCFFDIAVMRVRRNDILSVTHW